MWIMNLIKGHDIRQREAYKSSDFDCLFKTVENVVEGRIMDFCSCDKVLNL